MRLASLPGNGERGLKQDVRVIRRRACGASLPGNGERGLKLVDDVGPFGVRVGFAPRQRGAWIETYFV